MSYILIGLAGIILLWVFLRLFEKANIYFPTRVLEVTPGDFGLEYEDVRFTTEDNVELNGWFVPSEDSRGTVLFCHANGGNISHRIDFIPLLNRLRLNVFLFDYRGYGESKGRLSEKGTYLDALSAYRYMISRKDVSGERIFLFGRSLGGAVAIDLAAKVPVKGLIIEGTFTSIKDMAKEVFPFFPGFLISIHYDSISRIRDVKAPVLVIHSQEDELIPFSHGQRLYQEAREPKEFYILRGGHNDAPFMDTKEYEKRIGEFIEKHLL